MSILGIVTESAAVGAAVYQSFLDKHMATADVWSMPDVAVYSRELDANVDTDSKIYEGTRVMRKMNAEAVLFPEQDVAEDASLQRDVLVLPNVPLITAKDIEGIESFVALGVPPDDESKWQQFDDVMKKVDAFANALHEHLANDTGKILPQNKNTPSDEMVTAMNAQGRHGKGFSAIHGGMGPEASNEAHFEISEKTGGAVLTLHATSTPHVVHAMLGVLGELGPTIGMPTDPTNRLIDDRKKLESCKPDAIIMTCNTAHYYHDAMTENSKVSTVHIIEEGIKAIPEGETVVLLATDATVKSGLFEAAAERLGRDDVTLLLPNAEQQTSVEGAIWKHIIPLDFKAGGEKLKNIANEVDDKALIVAGCTEIIQGLRHTDVADHVLDTKTAGIEVLTMIVAEKNMSRSNAAAESPKLWVEKVGKNEASVTLPSKSTNLRWQDNVDNMDNVEKTPQRK